MAKFRSFEELLRKNFLKPYDVYVLGIQSLMSFITHYSESEEEDRFIFFLLGPAAGPK